MKKCFYIFIVVAILTSTLLYASTFITVKDALGRTVKVKEPVKRIDSLYSMIPQFLYLLDAGNVYYSGTLFGKNFYELLDHNLPSKIARGRNANVEEILKDAPQVVLCAYWQANERVVKQLESLGVPVVCTKLESVEDIEKTVLMLGKILQKEKKASNVLNYYTETVKNVKSRLKITSKPSVLILYYSGRHHSFRTFGGDMFQSKLVGLAGGKVVSFQLSGKKDINVEQILKWDPSVILIIQYGRSAEKIKESILKNSIWNEIDAVKHGKVYVVPNDGENWIDPCPKWPLGLYWLAKILHPKDFANVNIEKLAGEFYLNFFNVKISKVHISGSINQ